MTDSSSSQQPPLLDSSPPWLKIGLIQLRLVGAALILRMLGRILVLVVLAFHSSVAATHAALLSICDWLIVIPLGLTMYGLGAGQFRHRREQQLLVFCFRLLRPLAAFCLVVLPILLLLTTSASANSDSMQLMLVWSVRSVTSVVLCVLTGVALLALDHSTRSELRLLRLSASAYFSPRLVVPKRKRQRSTS